MTKASNYLSLIAIFVSRVIFESIPTGNFEIRTFTEKSKLTQKYQKKKIRSKIRMSLYVRFCSYMLASALYVVFLLYKLELRGLLKNGVMCSLNLICYMFGTWCDKCFELDLTCDLWMKFRILNLVRFVLLALRSWFVKF